MVSCKDHFKRLKKMGELKDRIFNIGSIALDKFRLEKKLNISDLKKFF